MTRHHVYFSPYFASEEFQKSGERKVEKAIENKFKSIVYIIANIWRKNRKSKIKQIAKKIAIEDKELFDRLKDQ